ncbi:hypothetical protein QQ020_05605 [Fulvivirgaceae bacterium BMA12]|uniref:Uncharacterized protein n=1 Tax=Agaribacillus aureus TaxID=3051825 RepID=A0ABT8L1A8_9BACT|nr:hypothetical protein [Fulvivirgaceae bacterium BMA12]
MTLSLLFASGAIAVKGQDYFPYTLLDDESAEYYYQLDRKTFGDSVELTNAIATLDKLPFLNLKNIFENNKINTTYNDSLRILRDSALLNIRTGHQMIDRLYRKKWYYKYLYRHSKSLTSSLWLYFLEDSDYYQPKIAAVLGQLNLQRSIKDSLLIHENVPDFVKARLGDKNIERNIIREFKNIVYDSLNESNQKKHTRFEELCNSLLYINSQSSINAYLEAFQSSATFFKIYREKEDFAPCHWCPKTIRCEWMVLGNLIDQLSHFYPYGLLTHNMASRYGIGEEAFTKYFSDMENLVSDIYNRPVVISVTRLDNGDCTPPGDIEIIIEEEDPTLSKVLSMNPDSIIFDDDNLISLIIWPYKEGKKEYRFYNIQGFYAISLFRNPDGKFDDPIYLTYDDNWVNIDKDPVFLADTFQTGFVNKMLSYQKKGNSWLTSYKKTKEYYYSPKGGDSVVFYQDFLGKYWESFKKLETVEIVNEDTVAIEYEDPPAYLSIPHTPEIRENISNKILEKLIYQDNVYFSSEEKFRNNNKLIFAIKADKCDGSISRLELLSEVGEENKKKIYKNLGSLPRILNPCRSRGKKSKLQSAFYIDMR